MKNVTVKLSNEQAARIESIAAMLEIEPGELMTLSTFSGFKGWEGSPNEALSAIRDDHTRYNAEKQVTGEEIETLLRGGLTVLPLEELLDVADMSTYCTEADEQDQQLAQDKQLAKSRMDFFEKVGKSLSLQSN